MKYCSKCGAQLADDDMYCYNCGSETKDLNEEKKVEKDAFDNYYENNYRNSNYYGEQRNTMATLGLVFSFISPILGLVFSIIGLNKSRLLDGVGRGQAIAGIIISILDFVLSFLIIYFFYPVE